MEKRLGISLCALALAGLTAACGDGGNSNNSNAANANNANAQSNTLAPGEPVAAPDNSTIVMTEEGGVRTETRTFREGPIERVVVTTRGGQRRARVFARDSEIRDLPEGRVGEALTAGGREVGNAAGFAADKLEDAAGEIGDKAEDVGGAAKTVGREVADKTEDAAGKARDGVREVGDKAEDLGDKTKSGAKKVGSGAKKVGRSITNAIKP